MKKNVLFVAAAICVATVMASMSMYAFRGQNEEWFQENVEALSDPEIIVGDLCMVAPGYACTSLGVVYEEHYPAK